ncbi:hypothetical protein CASFOL_013124 [Castilleja foliolosa]|uniref:DCD domain-containing protein n=1 Tax=Castilleja foliolosa TaxID=1961234 RepID=A0ABD3DMW3_9LAMI
MEYDDYNRDAESVPESGAIFMSNTLTKKESFKRKIFALPYTQAEFVKKIKVGMVLFIFEFKKRQLFGVYQASSDGAMDIVPHAFSSSGRRFPAQTAFANVCSGLANVDDDVFEQQRASTTVMTTEMGLSTG